MVSLLLKLYFRLPFIYVGFLIDVTTLDSRKVLAFLVVRTSYLKAIKRNSE